MLNGRRRPKKVSTKSSITLDASGNSPAAAAKLLRQIDAKCRLYASQPLMGEARPDLGSDVRCFPVGNYVVIYRPIDDGILVLLVVHGTREIPTVYRDLFASDGPTDQ